MVNTSTQLARAIVRDLISAGVTDVVMSPGSRSAALAFAFAQAQEVGLLKLHVRIDERDAGFLALGIAKATRRIVPVLVTSGSAVANLYPALVEAYQAGVSVLALTADRPLSVRGTTSPQTMDQENFFARFVTLALDVSDEQSAREIPQLLDQMNMMRRLPGQLNVQFEPPLMPEDVAWPELEQITKNQTVSALNQISNTDTQLVRESGDMSAFPLELPAHGLIIVGDTNGVDWSAEISHFASQLGWPVIWEPTSNVHGIPEAIAHGSLLLASGAAPEPECVVTIGTVGLSRSVLNVLKSTAQHLAIHLPSNGPLIPDPVLTAKYIFNEIPQARCIPDPGWMNIWEKASAKASQVIDNALSTHHLTGPNASVCLWNHLPNDSNLMVAASWPVRHLEAFAKPRPGLKAFGNRGVNGIDGLISTAWGIAADSLTRSYLLIGDVASLHDIGGFIVPQGTWQPDLTVVILDNDGGGIFSQLEQAQVQYSAHFEHIFGTPHGKDLWVIFESLGIPAQRVTTVAELSTALVRTDTTKGIHVIVCTTGLRQDEVNLLNKISVDVAHTLAERL